MKTTPPQNIAILGAGIMGLSTAYTLLKAKHCITLLDPAGFPADNASAIAGGMLAPYSEIEHMSMDWVQAGLSGIAFWQTHFPDNTTQNGSLLIAHEEDQYMLDRFRAHLPAELQRSTIPQTIERALPEKFQTSIHLTEEAHLDPALAMDSLYKAVEEMGAKLEPSAPSPEDLLNHYDHIIDCRGYEAAQDIADLRGVKGEIVIVRNKEFTLTRPVRLMHPRYPLYIVPRADNVFMIGATAIEAADKMLSVRSGLELLSALYSLHPSFGEADIIKIQAGIRPAYPDNLPRITIDDKIIRCNGLFRHGYLLAPIMAACVADHLAGKDHEFMHLFTKDRHEDHDKRQTETPRSTA